MTGPRKLWLTVFVLGVVGAGIFAALLIRHGVADVTAAFAAAGWDVALVVAFHAVVLVANVLAWHSLFPRERRLRFRTICWIRWIGESVQNLVPATAVGGEIVRARLAATRGVPGALAAATVIADITLGMVAQILFTLSGLYLLARFTGRAGMVMQAMIGAVTAIGAIGGFYAVQRFGIFRIINPLIRKMLSPDALQTVAQHGETLDDEVRAVYAQRRGVWESLLWSLLTWTTGVGEVWIALLALGVHASFNKAWILESMQQGIRAMAFLIPGAIGVQEGGYLVFGELLGISPEAALAVALIRRVRELSFGIPGLIAWQWVEGHWLFRRRPFGITR